MDTVTVLILAAIPFVLVPLILTSDTAIYKDRK
jgi:hypothetical protein